MTSVQRWRRWVPYAVLVAIGAGGLTVGYRAVAGDPGDCSGYACSPGWTGAHLSGGDPASDDVECGGTIYHGTVVDGDLRFMLPPGGCALFGPESGGGCGSTDLYNFTVVAGRHIDLGDVVNRSQVEFSNMFCGLSG